MPDGLTLLGQTAAETSRLISSTYPPNLDAEAHLWRRIGKTGEEHGEVIEALLGALGENPRKGVTNGLGEVVDELLDLALCALGAVEHLDGNRGRSASLLLTHAETKRDRLATVIARKDTAHA